MKKSDIALALGAALPFLMGGSSKTKLQFSKSEFERFQQGMPIKTVGSAALDWSKQQFEVFNSSKEERLTKDFHKKLGGLIIKLPPMGRDYRVLGPYDSIDINDKMTPKISNWGMFAPGLELPAGELLISSAEALNTPINGSIYPTGVSKALMGNNFTNYDAIRRMPLEFYQDLVIAGGFYMPMNIALRVYRMISSAELSGTTASRLHGFVVLYGSNGETALVSSAWFGAKIGYNRSGRVDFIQFINYLCQKNNLFVGYKYGEGLDELPTIGDVGFLAYQDRYDFRGIKGQFQSSEFLDKMPSVQSVDIEIDTQGNPPLIKNACTEVMFKGLGFTPVRFPVVFPSYDFS